MSKWDIALQLLNTELSPFYAPEPTRSDAQEKDKQRKTELRAKRKYAKWTTDRLAKMKANQQRRSE